MKKSLSVLAIHPIVIYSPFMLSKGLGLRLVFYKTTGLTGLMLSSLYFIEGTTYGSIKV